MRAIPPLRAELALKGDSKGGQNLRKGKRFGVLQGRQKWEKVTHLGVAKSGYQIPGVGNFPPGSVKKISALESTVGRNFKVRK